MKSLIRPLTRFSAAAGASSGLAIGNGEGTLDEPDTLASPLTRTFEAMGRPQGDAGNGAAEEDDEVTGGLHRITRTTNYWFEREVSGIEREAERLAHEWADKGLPRHDVPRTEPLQPEQVLAKRCAELFRAWQQRVRTKLQDAIEAAARHVEEQVGVFRTKVARLEAIELELDQRGARIEQIRRDTQQDGRPIRYVPLIKPVWFWIGAVALGLVEFMANFPVFRLLLPMNSALAKVASSMADQVDTESLGSGMWMLIAEWATHLEAVVVALVAVVVIVALGKFAGGSARAKFSLSADDHPTAGSTIRAHQREQAFKGWVSCLGIAFALAFLFMSRSDIANTTAERVQQDSSAVAAAEARLQAAQAAGNMAVMGTANTEVLELKETWLKHQEDARYAVTVERNNLPIALLNVALVLTAVLLGYAAAHADLTDKRDEHPDLVKLRDICNQLRAERIEVSREAREAAADARSSAARVRHLLRAQPLREWESKAQRLESVLPLFRGENARRRGLDPANVRAFDDQPTLDLPSVDELALPQEPAGFADALAELAQLARAQDRLAPASARDQIVAIEPIPAPAA